MIPKFVYRHNFSQRNSYRPDGVRIYCDVRILGIIVIGCLLSAGQVYAQTPQEEQPDTPEKISQADETTNDSTILKESGSDTETIANQPTAVEQAPKVQNDPLGVASDSPPTSTPVSNTSEIQSKVTVPVTGLSSGSTAKKDRPDETMSKLESRPLPPDPRQSKKTQQVSVASHQGTNDAAQSASGDSSLKSINTPDWILKTLGALGAVIGLILFLRPLLKRLAGPLGNARAPSGVIEALARYPFGKGQSLVLLKLDSRIILLCQTSQGSNLITEMTDPDDVASILRRVHDEKGESFNRKLEGLLHGGGGNDVVNRSHGQVQEISNSPGIVDLTSEGSGRSWWTRILGVKNSGLGSQQQIVTKIEVR